MDKTIVPTNFQSWPKIKTLIPDHKFIARELWCNQFVSASGVYQLDIDMFSVSIGFQTLNVETAIFDFVKKGIIEFDAETSEILICDWWRFHSCITPKQISIVQKSVDKIQSNRLKTSFFERIKHVCNKIKDLHSNTTNNSNFNPTTTPPAVGAADSPQQASPVGGSGDCSFLFPRKLPVELHAEIATLICGCERAAEILDELAAGLESATIKMPARWVRSILNRGLERTPEGLKKTQVRMEAEKKGVEGANANIQTF
jgi:hypothetical protein